MALTFTGAEGSFKLEYSSSDSDVEKAARDDRAGVGAGRAGVGIPEKLGVPRMLVSLSVMKLQTFVTRAMMLGDWRRVVMLSGM